MPCKRPSLDRLNSQSRGRGGGSGCGGKGEKEEEEEEEEKQTLKLFFYEILCHENGTTD
jgi:hypothetical protein